jgi:glycosyltransferase involved in cell wall biosynthesis
MRQKRILYFLNGLGRGGAELGLRTMLEHGLFAGFDLRIVVMFRGSEDLREDIVRFVGSANLIEGRVGTRLTLITAGIGGCKLLYQLAIFKPDIVVLSLKQANIIGRFILYFFPRVRCIAFEHIAHLEKGRAVRVYERALRALSGRVDEVWGDCPATLEATRSYYDKPPKSQTFVPLFVASQHAKPKIDYTLHKPARIAAACRLVSRKRLDILIRAVLIVIESGCKVELTIFGDGPARASLEKLAVDLGVGHAITFAGFVQDWWRTGAQSDIFVHLSEDEGFCITVAEAMMVGLPIIASRVGGVADYSQHLYNAIHSFSFDPAFIAEAIKDLLSNEEKRASLGGAAATTIQSHFGIEAIQGHYGKIAKVLAAPSASNKRP